MFQKITIHLESPICNCDEQTLAWGTLADENCRLYIECKKCKTKLSVPREKFVADFELKRSYPGKKPTPTPAPKPKLEVHDGGKVLPFGDPSAIDTIKL